MDDGQLLRYSRHILLPEIGVEGQEAFLGARVLIVGAGGLGSPAAIYLAVAGVGTLVLADDDEVDLTNLQRQIIHANDAVGRLKVESARDSLLRLNPGTRIETVARRLEGRPLDGRLLLLDGLEMEWRRVGFGRDPACPVCSSPA